MFVEEVMSTNPYAATVTSSVRQALQILNELDIRHLPVVDDGTLIGIVSDRDLRAFTPISLNEVERTETLRKALSQPISAVMNTSLLLVNPKTEVAEAIDLMIEHRIGAIPVVEPDGQTLVGIVSYVDVLRSLRDLVE